MSNLGRNRLKVAAIEEQRDKSKKQRNSQVKLITCWQNTQEVTPAFRRLMALLLQQKTEPKGKEEGNDENC